MLLPISEAKPAELEAALTARHMIASLILLDRRLAFRTRLGVGYNPASVLTLRLFLVEPLLHLATASRRVILLTAHYAVVVAAPTINVCHVRAGTDFSE